MGIKKSEIDVILIRLKEMTNVIRPDAKCRKTEVKQHKAEALITPADTIEWGRSQFIQSTRQSIKLIRANPTAKILPVIACDIRNYLMVEICLGNATRCSNIRELRLEDFIQAKVSDLPDAMEINSDLYKTSLIYGRKSLQFPLEIFQELDTFVRIVRPRFVAEGNVFVCTSLVARKGAVINQQMTHTAVSKCLTSSFIKNGALKSGSWGEESVMCSRLRTSIATVLVSSEGVDIETLA